ncbi:OPT oligopeptide transporter protein-domain-containing protein [Mycena rebaudengoi]|nr:OPT oligopeptide transporter protein-domain-containing protein [Mycena rebaudengoi]
MSALVDTTTRASDHDSSDLEKASAHDEKAVHHDRHNLTAALPEFDDPNLNKDAAIAAGILEDDSPYPEVRSAVANTDDPSIPVATVRARTLGVIWAIIIPGLNQFFFFRYPAVTVTSIVAQLPTSPLGRAWARFFPNVKIFGIALNPDTTGPFSIKEHVLITIMAGIGASNVYATDIAYYLTVVVQRVYYEQNHNFGYQWMVVMSTQLIGFSIGGIVRRFLVQPPSMIWPYNLVTCALFNTLRAQQYAGVGSRGGFSREKFFYLAFAANAVWYLVPGYLLTALSYFLWVCWIVPDNIVVNQLFGINYGLAMGMVTFDWAQITYIGSPLATPWWAEANIAVGFVFFWILTPALYVGSFDNRDKTYKVANIFTDKVFDEAKYKAYSPIFLSTTFAISYGLSFASITATITHALSGRSPVVRCTSSRISTQGLWLSIPRCVPQWWWYIIIFLSMFVFGVVSIEVWDTKFPVQYFILALVIAFFYVIPIGMIQAITNQQVGLNVITELIIGYALPGRPVSMMMFKTWGYITMAQDEGGRAPERLLDVAVAHVGDIGEHPRLHAELRRPGNDGPDDLAQEHDVLSAALDSGVAVSAVLIFFCLQYPRDGAIGKNTIQAWWGNNVYLNTQHRRRGEEAYVDPRRQPDVRACDVVSVFMRGVESGVRVVCICFARIP